jgi:hypothetical protein
MTTGPVEWVEGDVGWASEFGQGGAVEVDGLAAALDGRRPEPYVGGYTAAGAPRSAAIDREEAEQPDPDDSRRAKLLTSPRPRSGHGRRSGWSSWTPRSNRTNRRSRGRGCSAGSTSSGDSGAAAAVRLKPHRFEADVA